MGFLYFWWEIHETTYFGRNFYLLLGNISQINRGKFILFFVEKTKYIIFISVSFIYTTIEPGHFLSSCFR
jgi:hypothetical protein